MNRQIIGTSAKMLLVAALLSTTSTASATDCGQSHAHAGKDIIDTAVGAGSFNTLATALTKAELIGALKGKGPFTVFAPTDDAFAKLPKETLSALLKPENKGQLTAILTYHVVAGQVPAAQAVKLNNAKTLNGQQLDLKVMNGSLTIDGAKIVKTDIQCTNGVIHVIDSVMLPSDQDIVKTARSAGMFKTLLAAVDAAGLTPVLMGDGPFTVFAPTDDAFAKLPEGTVSSLLKPENRDQLQAILKYHVASGRAFASDALAANSVDTLQGDALKVRIVDGQARVNDAAIVKTDIDASNGVIHVIDSVLIPGKDGQASAFTPRDVIQLAIERGAAMFNQGNASACTAVYEIAASSLLAMNIPDAARTRLTVALDEMRRTHDLQQRAWILRHALDEAYNNMM